MPDTRRIKRKLDLPDGDQIVLYIWSDSLAPRLRNVERVNADGVVLWQAELPPSDAADCFVSLRREAGQVVVKTYSGEKYPLAIDTGRRA